MKEHIHTWNHYNEERDLCCSTCRMTYNEYFQKEKGLLEMMEVEEE